MATTPSIAMIPSGYKASKLYSVLPTDGTGDFTTSRASVATRVNENGLIEEVAANVPRLDYSDGGCPSLLLEPASTNLIPYSEDFSNAYWTKRRSIITLSSVISPDGNLTADKLVATAVNDNHYLTTPTVAVTATTPIAFSIFVKKEVYSKIGFREGITGAQVSFNLNTKLKMYEAGCVISYEDFGEFLKLKISYTSSSSGNAQWGIYVLDDSYTSGIPNAYDFIGDGTSGIYIWGAQLEENSYATSYIKTLGTTQTRVADTATGSGNSTVINSTEGVLYFEGSALANDGTNRMISLSNGVSTNSNATLYFTTTPNQIRFVYEVSSVLQCSIISTIDVLQDNKFAIVYKLNRFELWGNGVKLGEDISGSVNPSGTFTKLSFLRGSSQLPFYGKTKSVQVYTTALTDAELTTLTTI